MNTETTIIAPVTKPLPVFTIKQAIHGGYALAKVHFVEMVAVLAIVIALGTGGALTADPFANGVAMIVNFLAVYAYAVLALKAARGQQLHWHDLIDLSPRAFGSLIIASILSTLAISIGFGFLIVPGLMAAAAFCFYAFVLVDHKVGPVEALKRSMAVANPALWTIVGMYAAFFAAAVLPLVLSLCFGFVFQLIAPDMMLGLIIGSILGVPSVLWMMILFLGAALVSPFVHAWMYEKLGGGNRG